MMMFRYRPRYGGRLQFHNSEELLRSRYVRVLLDFQDHKPEGNGKKFDRIEEATKLTINL